MRLLGKASNIVLYARDLGIANAFSIATQKLRGLELITLHLQGVRNPLYCRSGDLYVFLEVFGKKYGEVYDPALKGNPRLIVDGGANVGFASVLFANRFPDATVVSVEPDAENCAIFRKNCSRYSNVKLLHAALWHQPGRVKITNPHDASFLFRVAEESDGSGGVPALTLSDIIAGENADVIDVLKLDIEGAEKVLFEHGGDWLRKVRLMIMELHDEYVEGCSSALFTALRGRDYRHSRIKKIDIIEFLDV